MRDTPERHAEPAHAAAVRLGHRAEGDAPRLPPRPLPRDPGQRARAHPARGDHHRHHRRLPRRDRGRLRRAPSTWSARPGSPPRSPSSTRSARAPRPRPCPTRCPRPVVQERYDRLVALVEEVATEENAQAGRHRRRGPRRRGGGPQGRRDAPHVRAGPGTTAWCTSRRTRPARAPATSSPPASPAPRRTTCSPTTRPLSVRRTRAGDAWAGPPARRRARRHPAGTGAARPPGAGPARHAARRG